LGNVEEYVKILRPKILSKNSLDMLRGCSNDVGELPAPSCADFSYPSPKTSDQNFETAFVFKIV